MLQAVDPVPHVAVDVPVPVVDVVEQVLPAFCAADDLDRGLFELVDDYRRDIDHLVIDPPFVSFGWCMRSAKQNLKGPGCSIIEIDDAGRMVRFWMCFDPAPFKGIGMSF